jgi:hypothetical protein
LVVNPYSTCPVADSFVPQETSALVAVIPPAVTPLIVGGVVSTVDVVVKVLSLPVAMFDEPSALFTR